LFRNSFKLSSLSVDGTDNETTGFSNE